jgi:glycine/D-amino acid oxidase-like deaminating enzyme/nitrite reductase/ring-hydroxylating ferredoxin subunit
MLAHGLLFGAIGQNQAPSKASAMKRTSPLPKAKSQSIWAATVKMPVCRRLTQALETDVCIVGAGIAGLTTAYLLTKAGKRVTVLDDGLIASGMTQVTTAHLSNEIDDGFTKMEHWHGEDAVRLAVQSHGAAIDLIERIANELRIDCDFQRVDGYLFLAPGHDEQYLEDELAAALRAGCDVEMAAESPVEALGRPCLRYRNQARVHIFKYLAGVAKAIKAQGGKICTNTHVDSIGVDDTGIAKVKAGDYTVTAGAVVVATNTPINDRFAIHTKQFPYMTYVIGARVRRGSVPDALYWDTLDAYHYVRLQPLETHDGDGEWDLLIVGGEDHKSGQADDADERHERLLSWTRERFPIENVEFTWGGQVMETMDGLAFIGRNPLDKENVYIATGDSGMGITHGSIAGMLLSDMILGRDNPWQQLYDPSRKNINAAGVFAKENLNVAAQYADWLTPGEVSSVNEIEPSCGAILRRGLTKVAVSRDENGGLTELSAVCPHLQCIVQWNNAEKTWDCPCHGSRFRADGQVINGPANSNLKPVEQEAAIS